jgi:serine/threonine-protein kinase
MLGSPMYMSPEQSRNAKYVDERADIWSLAVVLWEALSGKRLWGQQSSLGELIVAICTQPISRLEEIAPWVPRDLARVVHKGLERDVNQRTPSMQAFIAALDVFSGGTDRVTADQLVGLSDEHREVLARKSGSSLSPRPITLDPQSQPRTARVNLPPPAPLLVTTRTSGTPKSQTNAALIGVVLIVLAAAIGAAAAFLR